MFFHFIKHKPLISEELRAFPDHWCFPSGIVPNWIDNTFQKRSFQSKSYHLSNFQNRQSDSSSSADAMCHCELKNSGILQ